MGDARTTAADWIEGIGQASAGLAGLVPAGPAAGAFAAFGLIAGVIGGLVRGGHDALPIITRIIRSDALCAAVETHWEAKLRLRWPAESSR